MIMSSNKGKDGEMRAIRLVTYIGESEEGVDFTRPTTTNTPDMGADIVIEHPENYLQKMLKIASGDQPKNSDGAPIGNISKSRVDVKATDRKLQKDTVIKFVSDIRKHPDCKGQILMGGSGLTGPAQREFSAAQEIFSGDGKSLIYFNNEQTQRLEKHYRLLIEGKKNNGGEQDQ